MRIIKRDENVLVIRSPKLYFGLSLGLTCWIFGILSFYLLDQQSALEFSVSLFLVGLLFIFLIRVITMTIDRSKKIIHIVDRGIITKSAQYNFSQINHMNVIRGKNMGRRYINGHFYLILNDNTNIEVASISSDLAVYGIDDIVKTIRDFTGISYSGPSDNPSH